MSKKVYVRGYEKPTTGQHVRPYVREDTRTKRPVEKEAPEEGQKPSFLSDGFEEEPEDSDKGE